ncbi:hypothetical protein [Deinococcus arcticus]|nr:hypothetical protein [Deinococcus arcticus]
MTRDGSPPLAQVPTSQRSLAALLAGVERVYADGKLGQDATF